MTTAHAHGPRMNLWKHAPDVYKGMAAFEAAASKGLDPVLAELVKIRASQLNKCAFCLDMHFSDARGLGVSQLRLDLLDAWEEAPGLYTDKEQAALALTEAITRLDGGTPQGHYVPDEVYERAAEHFDEAELAHLIAQIVSINAWNRFQVATRAVPESLKGDGPR
ncbi:carboxymuconolactone decarboxylase family protein [Streptomyces sp. TRM43335]|uniref:Carboxymuconolactone decarboxylase family protein n=1 Tax=Streptomyces taklimakanensis TaxID=2569853 RepID=A0A6G2BEG8_9ACTN|nr:carboxymuconolactone decarboxylase family protein [Streptomyces taklimakanensis]MTE20677.1 carboxymuconolactone decarboxylase family protein [Streptomyces taklimakanensis]